MKQILRYVNNTCNYEIFYFYLINFSLVGYTDSDWVGNVETRKSIILCVFFILK